MTTLVKTATILICATLILSGCGEDSPTTQNDTPDTHDQHDAHDHDAHNATSQAVTEAQALIEAATKYINDNKLELAEKTLAQLDNLRADLPDSLNQKIDAAKTALAAAKTAAGKIEMPKLN